MISLIWAQSINGVIGVDGKLPWHIPEDLKRFKKLTTGKTVVMGRKTYESIGKPLPNRRNVVLTRNRDFKADGVEVIHDFNDALKMDDVFVIGGAQVYKIALPYAERLYCTVIHYIIDGDAFMPKINYLDFVPTRRCFFKTDTVGVSFMKYERKKQK